MAQEPNRTPTAFQAKQAAARAAQAQQRYQQDQAIAEQIPDPELKAEVLRDSEITRTREFAKANTVLEQTNSNLVTTPSASTATINSQIAPPMDTVPITDQTLLRAYVNQQLEPPADVPPVTNKDFPKASPDVANGKVSAKSSQDSPAAATTIPRQMGNVKFDFLENEFNQYDRVAYHFKLLMVNDLDAKDPQIGSKILNNQVRTIIVAESGVTVGFNITEVIIQDSLSPNFRSRSNLTTDISFKLLEPYAMTLPDRLYASSKLLGIPNWRLAPMFLQLEFRYIKNDGTIYQPKGDQKLVKLYSLLIIDFDSQVTAGGSIYDIKCSAQNNLGFRDFFQILPKSQNITLTASNTVQDFFQNLGRTITDLNLRARQQAGTSRVLPAVIEYKFVVRDPELQTQEIDWNPQKNQRRTSFKGGTGGEITVARGIGVSALVDDILSSLKNKDFFNANKQAGLFKIPIIECVTEIIAWDTALQYYVRRFTYVIGLKQSPRPVPYKEIAQEFEGNSNKQLARLQVLSQNMKKSYEYLYTGKNTEILNLDIKFNQLHVIVEPVMATVPDPQSTDSAQVNPRQQALKDKQQAETIVKESQQVEPVGNSEEFFNRLAAAQEQIARSDAILNDINNNSIIPLDPTSNVAEFFKKSTSSEQQLAAEAAATEIQNIRKNVNAQKGKTLFAEDVSRQLQALKLSFASDPRDMQNTQVRSVAGTSQFEDETTRPIVSSILTQIYDRVGSQMLEIDMEIRGDPYWLGITDVERAQELFNVIRQITQPTSQAAEPNTGSSATAASNKQKLNFVQTFDADTTILLKFRAGAQPDIETGFQQLSTESDFFYGIYTVIQVDHEFKDGKFTQKLKGHRDTLIDLSVIRGAELTTVNQTQPQVLPSVVGTGRQIGQSNNGVDTTQLVNNGESSGKMIARASNDPNTNQIALSPQQSTSSTMATNNSDYISGNSPEAVAARYAQLESVRQQSQNTEFAGYKGTQAANLGPSLNLTGVDGLGQGDNSRSVYLPQSTTYQRGGILEPGQSSMGTTIDPNTEYVDQYGLIQLKNKPQVFVNN